MPTKVKSKPAKAKSKAKPAPVKPKPRPASAATEPEPLPDSWIAPPATPDECLQRIQTLAHRVEAYVRFMKKIDDVRGTSMEAKQRALTAFYERLLYMERELGRVQEDLQLG